MRKKFLPVIMAGALALGLKTPGLAGDLDFRDLEEGKWYTESMRELADKGVLQGHKGLVRPNDQVTRAEYAQILNNILQEEGLLDLEGTDVSEDAWYYKAMRTAITHGIIRGDGGDSYRPNDKVTREEVFVMTARAFQLGSLDSSEEEDLTAKFKDHKDLGSWARKDTNSLIRAGYLKGNQENKLLPKKLITRAELSSLIRNIEEVKDLPSLGGKN